MTVRDPAGRVLSMQACSETMQSATGGVCPAHGSGDCVVVFWSERRLGQLSRREVERRWRDEWRPQADAARPAAPESRSRWGDIDELYRAGLTAAGCAAVVAVGLGIAALIFWSGDLAVVAALAGALALMTGLVSGLAAVDELARGERLAALARARAERGWEA